MHGGLPADPTAGKHRRAALGTSRIARKHDHWYMNMRKVSEHKCFDNIRLDALKIQKTNPHFGAIFGST
jgi:hypothetical protein